MAALGFSSGLPLLLTGFTLKQWMAVRGADVSAIGVASLIGLPYSLKFLWAPILDHGALPWPVRRFGRWRGWLLLTQPLLGFFCMALAFCDPGTAPALMMLIALLVAFLSANQDIAIDAWRIALFPSDRQGIALAFYIWGYRIAMLAASTGVIWLAQYSSWHVAYAVAGIALAAGILPTILAPAPTDPVEIDKAASPRFSWRERIGTAVIGPFRHFLSRADLRWALAFTALFNLGEGLAGSLTPKFYRELGFSNATVGKAIGLPNLAATLAGMAFGGWLVSKMGAKRALVLTGIVQALAMSLYFALALSGGSVAILYLKIIANSFSAAMASAAFLAFLSQLCSSTQVATEYALLSSLATLIPRLVDGGAGPMQKQLGWIGFYGFSIFASVPALLIMLHILRRYPAQPIAVHNDPVEH